MNVVFPKRAVCVLEVKVTGRTVDAVVLNTSLNRRGEAMVCSPQDALNMFFGSDLEYLVLEDWLVTKAEIRS